jgi:hypothetical protein
MEEKMSLLSERAVLAGLHIGNWSGTLHDRDISDETAERHKADARDSGRYTKQLVSKKALHHVGSHISAARRAHRLLTLPWDDLGTRILSNRGYIQYTEQMQLRRHAVEAAAHEFCANYEQYVNEAKTRLGSMFDATDYPSAESIQKRFYVDVEIRPVPEAADFRAQLSDDSVRAIVKDIETRTEARLQAAVNDVFERIADVTGKMVERLRAYKPSEGGGRPENTFKDSLVYNVQELADLIPALNITQDPRLDALQQRLLNELAGQSPDLLRDDDRLRNKTADAAEKILKKVQGFLS